jgi:hypothetical protein
MNFTAKIHRICRSAKTDLSPPASATPHALRHLFYDFSSIVIKSDRKLNTVWRGGNPILPKKMDGYIYKEKQ